MVASRNGKWALVPKTDKYLYASLEAVTGLDMKSLMPPAYGWLDVLIFPGPTLTTAEFVPMRSKIQ